MAHSPSYPPIKGGVTPDFLIEVGLGNIEGFSTLTVSGRNPMVGSVAEEDIWDSPGVMIYPTAGEQWELVSTSVNDASAGTGARTIAIQYLDANYVAQTEVVTLNGTTPVTTVATDMFRPRAMTTTTAGSLAENDGDVLLRAAGGGDTRGLMLAGNNRSMSVHYTVPVGVTAFILAITLEINKGEDVVIAFKATAGPSNIFIKVAESFIYQTQNRINTVSYQPLIEKSDFKTTAISSNAVASPAVVFEILEVRN